MKLTLLAFGLYSATAYGHSLNARQNGCPAPSNATCKELHDRCVGLPATWLQNPWSQRVCVAAATCYGVGNLLTSGACRQNKAPPNPRNLPGLPDAIFNNFKTCKNCAITRQNYIDFIYGTIQNAWPSSAQTVIQWWTDISAWTAFPSQNVPRRNFNDWLLYSTYPITVTPTTSSTTTTSTTTSTTSTTSSTTTSTTSTTTTSTTTTSTSTTTTSTSSPTATMIPGFVERCKKDVSISYDDGAFVYNRPIVDAFNAAGAKTTFFLNGNNFDCIYSEAVVADLRYAHEHGHVLASHTWFHTDITTITDDQLGAELDKLETALWKIVGVKPALFRPPYGSFNQRNIDYLNSRGYTVVGWDVDTGDSLGASVAQSMLNLQDDTVDGAMILAHETLQSTSEQLTPQMLNFVKSKNLKMVTTSECLEVQPYQAVGSYGTRDATWVC